MKKKIVKVVYEFSIAYENEAGLKHVIEVLRKDPCSFVGMGISDRGLAHQYTVARTKRKGVVVLG